MNPLKRARDDRGWSQSRLIAALEAEARALNYSLPDRASLKTSVSRWENGHRKPDKQYQQLLARALGLTPTQLGFEPADVTGLYTYPSREQCAFAAADLWSADMERRTFLRSAVFAASAFAAPALAAVIGNVSEPAQDGQQTSAEQGKVAMMRDMTRTLGQLDNHHGGGQVRSVALAYLTTEVSPLLRDSASAGSVRADLLGAAAELTQLVGWMTHDVGLHGLAQRHLIQALGLAHAAGDRALVAELLCAMSQQSTYLHESQGVDLARAARSVAQTRGISALVAESHVMEAHAHARAGAGPACAASLHAAERALDRADRDADPHWISYFDEAYVAAKFGHCFRELGDHRNAVQFAQRSLNMDESYVRGRAFNLALLAHAQADAGDVAAACETGITAIEAVAPLKSHRARAYVRGFRAALAPADGTQEVRQLDAHLVTLAA